MSLLIILIYCTLPLVFSNIQSILPEQNLVMRSNNYKEINMNTTNHPSYDYKNGVFNIYYFDKVALEFMQNKTKELTYDSDYIDTLEAWKYFESLYNILKNNLYYTNTNPSQHFYHIMYEMSILLKEIPVNHEYMLKYMINIFNRYMETCDSQNRYVYNNSYPCDLIYEDMCKVTDLCTGATEDILFPDTYNYTIDKYNSSFKLIMHYNKNYTDLAPFLYKINQDFTDAVNDFHKYFVHKFNLTSFREIGFENILYNVYLYDSKDYLYRYIYILKKDSDVGICFSNDGSIGCTVHTFLEKCFSRNDLINNFKHELTHNSLAYLLNTSYIEERKTTIIEGLPTFMNKYPLTEYYRLLPQTMTLEQAVFNTDNIYRCGHVWFEFITKSNKYDNILSRAFKAFQNKNFDLYIKYLKYYVNIASAHFDQWYKEERLIAEYFEPVEVSYDSAFFYSRFGDYELECYSDTFGNITLNPAYIFKNNVPISQRTLMIIQWTPEKDINCTSKIKTHIPPQMIYEDIFGHTKYRNLINIGFIKPYNYIKKLDPKKILMYLIDNNKYFEKDFKDLNIVIPFITNYNQLIVSEIINNTERHQFYKEFIKSTENTHNKIINTTNENENENVNKNNNINKNKNHKTTNTTNSTYKSNKKSMSSNNKKPKVYQIPVQTPPPPSQTPVIHQPNSIYQLSQFSLKTLISEIYKRSYYLPNNI